MIKTLRITSIVAAMAAVVLLILPAVFGVRSDPKIEEFLKSPGAVNNFLAAKGQRPARDESKTSPLVKQAALFHIYLDPPPPPPSPRATPSAARPAAQPAPPVPVTPKFKLVGTSFYAARPELSLALIDEPGKGFNWIRQGSTVGHLTIDKIKDGSITIRDGQGASEMTVTVSQPWRKLLKNPPPETQPAMASQQVPVQSAPPAEMEVSPEQVYEPSPLEKEKSAQIDRLMAEMGDNRITDDEAAKLDELTKLIEELGEIRAAELADANSPPEANR
ncbi:MAG: hypothetical protein ABII09_02445 [Planctomycetota bacterium]